MSISPMGSGTGCSKVQSTSPELLIFVIPLLNLGGTLGKKSHFSLFLRSSTELGGNPRKNYNFWLFLGS